MHHPYLEVDRPFIYVYKSLDKTVIFCCSFKWMEFYMTLFNFNDWGFHGGEDGDVLLGFDALKASR